MIKLFRETSGPNRYNKSDITKGQVRTGFSRIIDNYNIELIRKLPKEEAFNV